MTYVHTCMVMCNFERQRLMDDVGMRECQLKSIIEKVQVLEVSDRLQQQLSELRLEFEPLKSNGDAITRQLTQYIADRQALQDSIRTAKLWIEAKELDIRAGKTFPLTSVDAKKKLEDIKVALAELHDDTVLIMCNIGRDVTYFMAMLLSVP